MAKRAPVRSGLARPAVARRIAEHDARTGARYTRGRGPLHVVLVRRCRDKGRALRPEYAIKQLSRAANEALIALPVHGARARIHRTDRQPGLSSRRGQITIDPETRDIVQTIYQS